MIKENITTTLSNYLFSEEATNLFALLDGASIPDLLSSIDRYEPEYCCLYRGELEPEMEEVAPYLVRLEPDSEFTDLVIEQGWGKHWGVFAASDSNISVMRRHFRTFLIVHNSDGRPLYFRYYDPRVLRVYLPTCNAEELANFFGPVQYYILEDEDPNRALRFQMENGSLRQEKFKMNHEEHEAHEDF